MLRLNRDNLAEFLTNQRSIRAFENLINMVSETMPEALQSLELSGGAAQQQAADALSQIAEVAAVLSLVLQQPVGSGIVSDDSANLLPIAPVLQDQDASINLAPPVPDPYNVFGNAATATRLKTSRTIDDVVFDGTQNIKVIAPGTVAAPTKTAIVGADIFPLADSQDLNVLKKITWLDIKNALGIEINAGAIKATLPLTNGGGVLLGTLTNSPIAGPPSKWVPFDDNGTIRYQPLW
jgi:hypothetical protein